MAVILISDSDTVINCVSSKSNLDDLPFRENRIQKFLPVPKMKVPPLGTNVTKNARAAEG